jgi:hypothetical protein
MPRVCTICSHKDRAAINTAVAGGIGSIRQIAEEFGVSETSLRRHGKEHLPNAVRAAASVAAVHESATLLERVRSLYHEARAANDPRLALLAVGRLTKVMQVEGAALVALAERDQGPAARGDPVGQAGTLQALRVHRGRRDRRGRLARPERLWPLARRVARFSHSGRESRASAERLGDREVRPLAVVRS